jgi:hypothetical protein
MLQAVRRRRRLSWTIKLEGERVLGCGCLCTRITLYQKSQALNARTKTRACLRSLVGTSAILGGRNWPASRLQAPWECVCYGTNR